MKVLVPYEPITGRNFWTGKGLKGGFLGTVGPEDSPTHYICELIDSTNPNNYEEYAEGIPTERIKASALMARLGFTEEKIVRADGGEDSAIFLDRIKVNVPNGIRLNHPLTIEGAKFFADTLQANVSYTDITTDAEKEAWKANFLRACSEEEKHGGI